MSTHPRGFELLAILARPQTLLKITMYEVADFLSLPCGQFCNGCQVLTKYIISEASEKLALLVMWKNSKEKYLSLGG